MKPIAIAGIVVGSVLVVCAIVIPCVLLIPSNDDGTTEPVVDEKPSFAFDDIWSSKYNYRSIYPNWDRSTPSQTDFISSRDGEVERRDISKPYDRLELIADNTVYKKYNSNGYSVSPDAKFIYYRFNVTKVWRHSYTADYVVYDVVNKREVNIEGFPYAADIQHMEWSPVGHKLVFVHDFNVKIVDNLDNATPKVISVTPDGERNVKYYGIPDWMYEEEMIGSKNVIYWNTDATKFALLETREDGVEHIKYTWYGDDQYPETIEIAYPKAGTTISSVTLWVYDLASGSLDTLDAPAEFTAQKDYYFSRFTWKNNVTCLATWTNRWQTDSIGQLCKNNVGATTFTCTHNDANTESLDNGWVGSFGPFYPMWRTDGDANNYFTIYARANDGEPKDGYWQLAYVEEGNADRLWMTKTNYDIVGLNFYDETNQYIYFTAAHDEAKRRQILRVKATDRDIEQPECVTCDLIKKYENRCGWISSTFTDDGSSVVINCRGNWIPMTLHIAIDSTGKWDLDKLVVLENNDNLASEVEKVKWPYRTFGKFDSDKSDADYNYEIWFPEDFNATKVSEYPLLIEVYAGPEFQKVTDTWTKGFAQTYMVSGRNMIVASVDGRGSAYQGYKFMRENYLKLGQNEPVDQTDFANFLLKQYPSIDASRIGIWGWSYGGYVTSHTLGYDNGQTFECGIAVAPLADWFWYDAMYAERYMRGPVENPGGYKNASIIRGHPLENFKHSKYVLIHGTADDNVHFQSAAEMEKALVEADVDFDDFFYADEAHSINSKTVVSKHIYRQIDLRLSYCLGRVDQPYGG